MVAPSPERLRDALKAVLFPGFRRDIVTLGMVSEIRVDGPSVHVHLRPGTDKPETLAALRVGIDTALRREPGVERVQVHVASADAGRGRDPFKGRSAIPGVRHVIAVSSTKGGVGKSTVAMNLALALAERGHAVGIADADVYGPSLPIMLGTTARPTVSQEKRIAPVERYGLKLMSMGFFLDEQSPVIWRGPIVMGIIRQFLKDVDWGRLDFLVIDLPPGTGDAVLTLVQQVPVTGAVIVTTPQDVALLDVGRGIAMFAQVATPVLGVVENMAGYVCASCGTDDPIFGEGGGQRLADAFGVPLLGRIPLAPAVRVGGDAGTPIVVAEPRHPVSDAFRALAARVVEEADRAAATTPLGVEAE
ncbi:MAG TPA: Mrp/NBP35 family ATP-binding protein [Candidatus Eisenbacteria bacterium]|nr:Mrp/NBP35 family ATP-binding protein [Candidatus Eisenbacteria bacterium]